MDVRATFGLSPIDECIVTPLTNSTTKSCKCVKVGNETAVVCESIGGVKCATSSCGTAYNASNRKKWGIEKCGCTYPEVAKQHASAYAYAYATHMEYAHGFPRPRIPRISTNGNDMAGGA